MTSEITNLSETRRALLAKYLQGDFQQVTKKQEAIPRRTTGNSAPLSFAQQRLWFLEQLEPGSTAYLISIARHLHDALEHVLLTRSIEEMVQRHEILRTTFQLNAGQPLQIIHAPASFHLPLIDLQTLSHEERHAQARHLAEQETHVPVDLVQGPLLRVSLARLHHREYLLLVTMHHSISDGWSNDIFFRELLIIYRAFASGKASPLPPLPLQYADYAIWQRQRLQGKILDAQLAYWKKQLENAPPLELPTDHPRPALQNVQGRSQIYWLPQSLHDSLVAFSQNTDVTLFMLLLTAFQLLLMRYTGQCDISVGTPITNRPRRELEGLIGLFVNTLVLRSDLSGNPSFLAALQHVREVVLEAHAHQDVPFEQLVDLLQPERDLSRSPLFQIMFSVQLLSTTSTQTANAKEPGAATFEESGEAIATKFDLEMHVMSGERGLRCAIAYRTDLFEDHTIIRLLEHYHILLEGIVAHPQQKLAYIPLLTAEEQDCLLLQRNRTQSPYPLGQSFVQLFKIQAATTPSRIALIYEKEHMTYAELDRRANQLAHCLQTSGIGPEVLVGLYMERSLEMVVAILGIFKAGGAYVPLDAALPTDRLRTIVEDADLHTVITQPALQTSVAPFAATIITLEASWKVLANYSEHEPSGSSLPAQLAYVIYTSGSTGRPKGAMVHQRGMLNHLYAKIEALQLGNEDIVAQTASHCFDISVWQFLAALLVGARVQIFPDQITHDPIQLFEKTTTAGISIHEVVPSLLHTFLMYRKTSDTASMPQTYATYVRWLLATGEMLPVDVALLWMHFYPGVSLLNAYGPTECSDDVTHAVLTPSDLAQHATVPIGYPIANTHIYLLDDTLALVPDGIPAQIYVGGTGVGRGYLGDPARTASVFLPDPFGTDPGARLYKTGDMGRYRQDGAIEFLHRIDQQVKIRGYRIELGEIEATLQHYPAIQEAVALVREDVPNTQQLVAYVVAENMLPATLDELRTYLRERLPHYMLPSAIVTLQQLPRTANGKINRKALPSPQDEMLEAPSEQKARSTFSPTEELLLTIWQEILGQTHISKHDNFFVLGGHSLLATQLVSRIRTLLQVELPLRTLFETPTLAGLARQVEHARQHNLSVETPPLLPIPRGQEAALSFAQRRIWFIQQLESDSTAYLIPRIQYLRGPLSIGILEYSLLKLIQRHESLRTTFGMRGDEPVQVIHPYSTLRLPLIDLHGLAPEARVHAANQLASQEATQPCNLMHGPLLRTHILRMEQDEHVLLLTIHHIVADGWSLQILTRDLTLLYQARSAERPVPLPPLPIQYADYALWQRQWLQGPILEAHLAYWQRQLAGAPQLQLPGSRPRPEIQNYQGAAQSFHLSDELSHKLITCSQREGVTLFMLLLAAFQILLHHYSKQEDILVGTDVANRTHAEIEGLIGFFINQLVLRINLAGNPALHALLQQVREVALEAYAHQDLPFDRLVEAMRPVRALSHTPLFQVKFVLQNAPHHTHQDASISTKILAPKVTTAKFDLILNIAEGPHHLSGWLEYSTAIFDAEYITHMIEHLKLILEYMVAHSDCHLEDIDMQLASAILEEQHLQELKLRQMSQHKLGHTQRKRL